MQASEFAKNCYILKHDDEERFGILVLKDDSRVLLITSEFNEYFDSLSDIEESTGKINFTTKENKEATEDIDGFPLRHSNPVNIEHEDGHIFYTQNEHSSVYWAAGWYILRYGDRFVPFLNPKKSTINKKESYGPFKDKLTVDQEAKIKTQEIQDASIA